MSQHSLGEDRAVHHDLPREEVVIFVAEGVVCERHGVSIDDAVSVLVEMAVVRGTSLTAMARDIVLGVVDPRSLVEDRKPPPTQVAEQERS